MATYKTDEQLEELVRKFLMRYDELIQKRFGAVPMGLERIAAIKVFLYNPDDLPGLHEIGGPQFDMTDSGPIARRGSLLNIIEMTIDGENYAVATEGFTDADYEHIE
jgi:hypothetical protein